MNSDLNHLNQSPTALQANNGRSARRSRHEVRPSTQDHRTPTPNLDSIMAAGNSFGLIGTAIQDQSANNLPMYDSIAELEEDSLLKLLKSQSIYEPPAPQYHLHRKASQQ